MIRKIVILASLWAVFLSSPSMAKKTEFPGLAKLTNEMDVDNWKPSLFLRALVNTKDMGQALSEAKQLRDKLIPSLLPIPRSDLTNISDVAKLEAAVQEKYQQWIVNYNAMQNKLTDITVLANRYLKTIGSKIGLSSSRQILANIIRGANDFKVVLTKVRTGITENDYMNLKSIFMARTLDQWDIVAGNKYPAIARKYMDGLEERAKTVVNLDDWTAEKVQSEFIRGVGTVTARDKLGMPDNIKLFWREASLDNWQPCYEVADCNEVSAVKQKWDALREKISETRAVLDAN